MRFKVDFHTHSSLSYDGGLTKSDYTKILQKRILDVVSITDHNDISFALQLKKEFGEKIIIGEEIESLDGEIIGLFLTKKISPGLSAKNTIRQIRLQKGLVYIPHPFERQRKSIQIEAFEINKKEIDVVEVFNGRSFGRSKNQNALNVAIDNNFGKAASSDGHCALGVGTAYTLTDALPEAKNILSLLKNATYSKKYPPILTYICPFINKIGKKINL